MEVNISKFIKVREAAEMLGFSDTKIRAAIRRGELPGIRVGCSYLIPRDGLDRLLAQANEAPVSTPASVA